MKKGNESDAAMNLDDEVEEFLDNGPLGADKQPSAVETLKLIHQFELEQKEIIFLSMISAIASKGVLSSHSS